LFATALAWGKTPVHAASTPGLYNCREEARVAHKDTPLHFGNYVALGI
jgi:hypothetical protein